MVLKTTNYLFDLDSSFLNNPLKSKELFGAMFPEIMQKKHCQYQLLPQFLST